VELNHYIEVVENCVGKKAIKNLLPLQPGDVPDTYADVTALTDDTGYKPNTSVEVGVARFVEWFVDYYNIDLDKA
jgi:UDP-glucuronate 4-epimerase